MAQMVARTWGYQMPYVIPSQGSDTYNYTFHVANQLTNVQTPSGTVSFTYDGDGQRIKKISASGTIVYVRDAGNEVIAEYTGSGVLLAEYVYADGKRLCKVTKDAQNVERRVYYHADFLGTPLVETNESGQVLAKAEYHPFGEEAEAGSATDPHKFTGKELDSEFGLYYFGARYYDAHLGRFISVDPVGGASSDPQTWNRYAYARNNPLKYVDPDGRTIDYSPAFKARIKSDPVFRSAHQSWLSRPSGRAQHARMGGDSNTKYVFDVGSLLKYGGPGVFGHTSPKGLEQAQYKDANEQGKMDYPNVIMTIDVDARKATGRQPTSIADELAKTLFHEAEHGLDIGSGTRTCQQANDRDSRQDEWGLTRETDPAMVRFKSQRNAGVEVRAAEDGK
jgi:RHS repeat-associated protein